MVSKKMEPIGLTGSAIPVSPSSHGQPTSNDTWRIFVMIIASIFLAYYLTMTFLLRTNKVDSRNKLYQSLLMGFWMGVIALATIGLIARKWSPFYTFLLIIMVIGVVALSWLIYTQTGINQNQFLLRIIEHHQMAIDMAILVKPKTGNDKILTIVNDIIDVQTKRIAEMRDILRENQVPGNITSLLY